MTSADRAPAPVVVGVGGSQAALCAAEWAVDEAVSRAAPLRLVHAVWTRDGRTVDTRVEYAAHVLLAAGAAVNARGKPVRIDAGIVSGDPATVLINESECASLLCVGRDGSRRHSPAGIGPTAAALGRWSRCPVAIIPDGPPSSALQADPIAVSVHNHAAVKMALEEARLRGATVIVVVTGRLSGDQARTDAALEAMARCWMSYASVPVEIVSTDSDIFDYLDNHPGEVRTVVIGAEDADELDAVCTAAHKTRVRRQSCILIARR